MDWFEKNSLKKRHENCWTRKIASNNVSLYWQDETDPYHPNQWYCIVEGHRGFYADSKEQAFAGALDVFERKLFFEKDRLEKRIMQIHEARTEALPL